VKDTASPEVATLSREWVRGAFLFPPSKDGAPSGMKSLKQRILNVKAFNSLQVIIKFARNGFSYKKVVRN